MQLSSLIDHTFLINNHFFLQLLKWDKWARLGSNETLKLHLEPWFTNDAQYNYIHVMQELQKKKKKKSHTLTSCIHNFFNSGSPRIVETINAPWTGGLLYIGRPICCNWLFTATASISLSHKMLHQIAYSAPLVQKESQMQIKI